MVKKYDNRVASRIQHGKSSKAVDKIMKKISLAPFSEAESIQMERFSTDMIKKSIALDIDSYSRQLIADHLKETGLQVTTYESDLYNTQSKLAELEASDAFHKKVVIELQNQYMYELDPKIKSQLLSEIRSEEDSLKVTSKLYNELLNTRNKIRNGIDRKQRESSSKSDIPVVYAIRDDF